MKGKPQLVYDGICNLCTSAVRFLYILDRAHELDFVAYQQLGATYRRQYALTDILLQGRMHVIKENGGLASGSLAIREVCRLVFPLKFICDLFKTHQAQRFYEWIAQRRYRIFGCRDTCYVMKPPQV